MNNEQAELLMALFDVKPQIANSDIQKILTCSDATATRYLAALSSAGRVRKIGKGRGVRYMRM